MKPLVALYGFPGSGKDTIAKYLEFFNFDHVKVSQPIKAAVCALFDWTPEQVEDRVEKEIVDPRWGISPRQAARFVGHEMLRALGEDCPAFKDKTGYDLYGRILAQKLNALSGHTTGVVVSDIRFPSEWNTLLTYRYKQDSPYDVIVLNVQRPGSDPSRSGHASEAWYSSFTPHAVIVNDGTEEALIQKVHTIMSARGY